MTALFPRWGGSFNISEFFCSIWSTSAIKVKDFSGGKDLVFWHKTKKRHKIISIHVITPILALLSAKSILFNHVFMKAEINPGVICVIVCSSIAISLHQDLSAAPSCFGLLITPKHLFCLLRPVIHILLVPPLFSTWPYFSFLWVHLSAHIFQQRTPLVWPCCHAGLGCGERSPMSSSSSPDYLPG